MSEVVKRKRLPVPVGIGRRGFDPLGFLDKFGALTFLIVLVLLFSASSQEFRDSFFNPLNLFNVMRQVSITGLIAIGMTFVILTGGIDLSVGSLLALSGMVAAAVYKGGTGLLDTRAEQTSGVGVGVAIAVACLVGLSGGLLQGLAITKLKVPPFIVTLGGLSAFRGVALLLAGGGPISAFDTNFTWWGKGKIFDQLPIPVLIFLGFALLAFIILRYTQYGRYIYAVGGNPEAARLSGLNTTLLVLSVYMIVGFLAGLGGFVQAARVNSAEQVAGIGYELTVIAAVVIGGTSLFGGEGGVLGTVIGSVFIGVLQNGLQLMNVQSYTQQIIIGVIVVLAVFVDRMIKSRRR